MGRQTQFIACVSGTDWGGMSTEGVDEFELNRKELASQNENCKITKWQI